MSKTRQGETAARWPVTMAACLTALAIAAAAPVGAANYRPGDLIEVQGVVSDVAGHPVAGVEVMLEGTRSNFDLRRFRRVRRNPKRVETRTNTQGEFTLEWTWDGYYNRFDLFATAPDPADPMRLRVLAATDLSRRFMRGSPVITTLTVDEGVPDAPPPAGPAPAPASASAPAPAGTSAAGSTDEARVRSQMGSPDRAETVAGETSWWYFEAGKAYFFRQGELEQVVHFDPVVPF